MSICLSVSEQNADRTDASIQTRFLLNDCFLTGTNPIIETDDLGSMVKVTVTENLSQKDEK